MPGSARVGDLAIGIDAHPVPPFVFPWVGTPIVGSPPISASGLPDVKIGDMYVTTCPICGVGTALTGAPSVLNLGPPEHRKGDVAITPGGIGTSIIGAGSVLG